MARSNGHVGAPTPPRAGKSQAVKSPDSKSPDVKSPAPAAELGPGASRSAADAIREMILTGKLRSGAKVPPERELAQMFGFSRGSVREAVRELSALGILTARQGDGTYVSTLKSIDLFAPLDFVLLVDPRSLLDVIDLRLLLEPHVASIAAARIEPDDLVALQDALTRYQHSVDHDPHDYELLLELDDTMHKILLRQAENPLIEAIVRSIDSLVRRGRELTVVMESSLLESANELRAVVAAVADRDPARAHAAMTWHITCWAEHIRTEADPRLRSAD